MKKSHSLLHQIPKRGVSPFDLRDVFPHEGIPVEGKRGKRKRHEERQVRRQIKGNAIAFKERNMPVLCPNILAGKGGERFTNLPQGEGKNFCT